MPSLHASSAFSSHENECLNGYFWLRTVTVPKMETIRPQSLGWEGELRMLFIPFPGRSTLSVYHRFEDLEIPGIWSLWDIQYFFQAKITVWPSSWTPCIWMNTTNWDLSQIYGVGRVQVSWRPQIVYHGRLVRKFSHTWVGICVERTALHTMPSAGGTWLYI